MVPSLFLARAYLDTVDYRRAPKARRAARPSWRTGWTVKPRAY